MKRRLPRKAKSENPELPELSAEDQKTAESTRQLMQHIRHESLQLSEKTYLWTRVEESIQQKRHVRINRLWYSVAASVAVALISTLGYFSLNRGAGAAMQKVAAAAAVDSEATRLVLADQRMISLEKQNSSLTYGKNGSLIRVDSVTAIDQQVSGQEFNTLIVPYGKRSVITLTDGTRIWVNSGSKLVYPAQFTGKDREVYLEGQAYFSVTHAEDKPFFVHTKNMKVQVFGTEFDVSAYGDDPQASTVLVNGSIELTANQQSIFKAKKRRLQPGMRAVYDPGNTSLNVEQVNVMEYVSWKDGYLLNRRAPLGEILKKLSRYYKVDIELAETDSRLKTFSGSLDLQEDITHVLDIVSAATALEYHQTERRFVLGKSTITQ
ncbi:FecR family protein [Dyadobacter crusticola]|uniref:FecR family protein n=1 Tax=Dyadobacter crusticola TaxID=292407 RepID=UPI0004E2269A|nr:FecR domain-containing protein [Dyadobacter crusticola]